MSAAADRKSAARGTAVRRTAARRAAVRRTVKANRLLAGFALLAAGFLVAASRVHVNASWSGGAWGYFVLPLVGEPERDDAILFDPPEAAGSTVPYLKTVRGLPGDRVEVDRDRRVLVNGAVLGIAKTHALDGRALEAIGPGVIPPGRYYVHADHADSHDSRYAEIGLIPGERIRGRAWALPDVPWLGIEGPFAKPKEARP